MSTGSCSTWTTPSGSITCQPRSSIPSLVPRGGGNLLMCSSKSLRRNPKSAPGRFFFTDRAESIRPYIYIPPPGGSTNDHTFASIWAIFSAKFFRVSSFGCLDICYKIHQILQNCIFKYKFTSLGTGDLVPKTLIINNKIDSVEKHI